MNGTTSPINSLDLPAEAKVLKKTIAIKEKQYDLLIKKIESIKSDLNQFEYLYNRKIKRLYNYLDELEQLLFKYHNINEYVDEIFSYAEAEKIFEETMKDRRARMEDDFKNRSKTKIRDKKSTMHFEQRDELKRLYRKLAHLFHPDKMGGDEQLMKKINQAYREGDLKALQDMDLQLIPEVDDHTISGLERHLTQLIRLIDKATRELTTLKKSDTYVLRKNLLKEYKDSKENALDLLAKKLRKEINKKQEQVDQFVEKFGVEEEISR